MNYMDDNTLLSQISMPGTHNTMARMPRLPWVRNQTMNLENQLYSGIRYLDIRLHAHHGSFAIYHGCIYVRAMFEDVLRIVNSFLDKNPSEVILMRLKQEHTPVPWNEFNRILASYLNRPQYQGLFYRGGSLNPVLSEMRGKIVVLRDYVVNNDTRVGIPYSGNQVHIQDNFSVPRNQVARKRQDVRQYLDLANNHGGTRRVINHLSGTGFPTATPRHIAISMNPFAVNHIQNNALKYIGIVISDFPGRELINAIIDCNMRSGHKRPSVDYDFPPILPSFFRVPFGLEGTSHANTHPSNSDNHSVNIARSIVTYRLYARLKSFDGKLGYEKGSAVSFEVPLHPKTGGFDLLNRRANLGYNYYRNWGNVWSIGRFGVGRHDRHTLVLLQDFPIRTFRTIDQTVEVEISPGPWETSIGGYNHGYSSFNVVLRRIRGSNTTDSRLNYHRIFSVPIVCHHHRWNAPGRRINDLSFRNSVALIHSTLGRLHGWNMSGNIERPPQIAIIPRDSQFNMFLGEQLYEPSHYVEVINQMNGGDIIYQWLTKPDVSSVGIRRGTIEVIDELDFYRHTAKVDITINVEAAETVKTFEDLFADKNLAEIVARRFSRSKTDAVNKPELNSLTGSIIANDRGIRDLGGIKLLTSISYFNLNDNQIRSVECLNNLENVTDLHIDDNQIEDIESLYNLTNLNNLSLNGATISYNEFFQF